MDSSPIPTSARAQADRLGIALREDQWQTLARYLNMLLAANEQFNLTAIKDAQQAWDRHIIDSLTVLEGVCDLEAQMTVVDVGSGGGLPGIPLAIARPDLHFILLEATGKKARFLQQCVKELPLPHTTVINARAEQAGQDRRYRERFDAAVCRAVGPMNELLEYTLPLVREGGFVLAMKGPSVEVELEKASDALSILGAGELQVVDAYPSDSPMRTVIVCVTKIRPTPGAYPRLPGIPRHEPL